MTTVRLTASDRPGVAQPVPERDIPARPWSRILLLALVLSTLLLGAWEWHWRDFGNRPSMRNSDGLWAMQRRRIDTGEGHRTALVGDSRMLFDVDLDTWERLSGERPIQLAFEGTSAAFGLDDLAADPNFTGRIVVGLSPLNLYNGQSLHEGAWKYYRKESPSQRVGQWLSMHLIEPYFAFYEPDFALSTIIKRQAWPKREGLRVRTEPRKLSRTQADRDTALWSKVETDPDYLALVRRIWTERFAPLDAGRRAALDKSTDTQIARVAAAIRTLRARGVPVVLVDMPSSGPFQAYEHRDFPRVQTWDRLLEATGAPGIHFEDHPELQGYELPEWSHLAARERPRFTEALYRLVDRERGRGRSTP